MSLNDDDWLQSSGGGHGEPSPQPFNEPVLFGDSSQNRIQNRIMLAPTCLQVDARNEPDLNRIAAGRAAEFPGAWPAGHRV